MPESSGTERARTTLAYLRRQITTGAWAVGSRIPIEPELAQTLGVGRSTIREAVRSLASIGMLETMPGRGTFVRASAPSSALLAEFLNAYTLEELLSYRRALEVEAAQQAALHRTAEDVATLEEAVSVALHRDHCTAFGTEESARELASRFHHLLFDAAKNRLLASLYAGITDKLNAPGYVERLTHASDGATMQTEHQRIVEAVRDGDFIDAAHAMADHVDNDLVIRTPDARIIPPLQRSAAAQRRVEQARGREREGRDGAAVADRPGA